MENLWYMVCMNYCVFYCFEDQTTIMLFPNMGSNNLTGNDIYNGYQVPKSPLKFKKADI